VTGAGTEVDDPVGVRHHREVLLDHEATCLETRPGWHPHVTHLSPGSARETANLAAKN
jgi:hypothetical protein